jgi:hypothetical protein
MKTLNVLGLLVVAIGFASSAAFAGGKSAIAVGDVAVIKSTNMDWRTIIPTTIRSSNNKTLMMNVSLECGLYTNTTASSKNMVTATSTATASVEVRVLVDGQQAAPGDVVFCNRMQQLSATLQGALLSCTDMLDMSKCTTTEETIQLIQDTMNANAFNFALVVPTGDHKVEVQARINTALSGTSSANATIGKGAITVEEVNLIPSKNVISF